MAEAFKTAFCLLHPDNSIPEKQKNENWESFVQAFHLELRNSINSCRSTFRQQVDEGRTTTAWLGLCSAIEDAFCRFLKMDDATKRRHQGRGKPRLRT